MKKNNLFILLSFIFVFLLIILLNNNYNLVRYLIYICLICINYLIALENKPNIKALGFGITRKQFKKRMIKSYFILIILAIICYVLVNFFLLLINSNHNINIKEIINDSSIFIFISVFIQLLIMNIKKVKNIIFLVILILAFIVKTFTIDLTFINVTINLTLSLFLIYIFVKSEEIIVL